MVTKTKILSILMRKENIYICFIIFVLLMLTALKLHGSSIAIYNRIIPGYGQKNLVYGQVRAVRGDEWMVSTPLTIAQSHNNFKAKNYLIGSGQEMSVILDAPTAHWSTFFRPYNWSFFVLPFEYAFAFKWWFRGALIMIASYLFLLYFTKKNYLVSIGLSLFLYLSPFIHWWYSTLGVEAIAFSFFILYFFMKIIHSLSSREIAINTLFLIFFTGCFALIPYPPFLLSLGLFLLFFIVGYSFSYKALIAKQKKKYLFSFLVYVASVLVILFSYYISFRPAITLIRNTVYPGHRYVEGGSFPASLLFNGFYNIQFLKESRVVPVSVGGNQSEGSNFFMLFPFVIIALLLGYKKYISKKNIDYQLIALIMYFLFVLTWMFFGLPEIIARITLIDLIPHTRNLIGLGMANVIFLAYFLSFLKIDQKNRRNIAYLLGVLGFLITLLIGADLSSGHLFIESDTKIFLISAVVFFSVILLLLQKTKLFLTLVLIWGLLSCIPVNPISRGFGVLTGSVLSQQIDMMKKKDNHNYKWMTYNNFMLGEYLTVNGVSALDTVYYYPQFSIWKTLDPDGKHVSVYNRYAHVLFSPNVDEKIDFAVIRADTFGVSINPCNTKLRKLDVKYFIFLKKVTYPCLREVKRISPKLIFYFYELK